MTLKLLLVPFFIIMALVVGIGMAKPEYDTLMQKRAELAQKKTEVDRLETLRSNIDALTMSLEQNKDQEDFMLRFYPVKLDQERVIDAFNFLSAQSGLIVAGMDIKELTVPQVELDPALEGAAGPLGVVPGEGSPDALGMSATPVYVPQKPSYFVAQVKLKGNYDNIKSFLARLYTLDRMHEVKNVTVVAPKKEGETEEDVPADILEASFEARFDFVEDIDNKNAIGAAIFGKNAFDLAKVTKAEEWAATAMANLTVDKAGRANPFQ